MTPVEINLLVNVYIILLFIFKTSFFCTLHSKLAKEKIFKIPRDIERSICPIKKSLASHYEILFYILYIYKNLERYLPSLQRDGH